MEKLGSGLGGIFTGWTSKTISLRDQLSADLEKARHSKRNGRFEESLDIINGVLNKDQSFPDALYLKAQILWEGFGRTAESKKLFRKV
ncbi:tetratricopeptide repeat protein, partial [Thermodesulfobacteriota bacterium]